MAVHSHRAAGDNAPHPLDTFTDREGILALFQQTLRSARAGHLHVLAIKGNSGTGKTFLISYLLERVCPRLPWQAGTMSFAQSTPDFRTILVGLEHGLKGCVPSARLERYRTARDEYNRRFDEYKTAINIGSIQQHMSVSGDQSSIANSLQSIQINTQLHERELHLRADLTRALLELAEVSEHPLCLFIDGYERLTEAAPELPGWFWEEVVPGLAKALPHPFPVITCGWQWPSNATIEPFIQRTELTDFDVEQMKVFLEKQEAIPSSTDPTPAAREELISAFYDLTQGHPLVLGLAVTYFKHLPPAERTAVRLRANAPLIDSRARVEFLEQRLLERLPEPDRTLLERGPILRGLDQSALQALLSIERAGTEKGRVVFDDATYDRFLRYPFINRESRVEQGVQEIQPTFHELVRRVQVETLRRRPDQLKEQLHRTMVDYYQGRIEVERMQAAAEAPRPGREVEQSWFRRMRNQIRHLGQHPSKKTSEAGASREESAVWLVEMPEPAFRAHVEYLYHALQLRTHQDEAFVAWQAAIGQAINGWRRRQAEALLELIKQLVQEGEPFLSPGSQPYGQYLLWSARFLEQDLRWQQAQTVLNQAAQVFEQGGKQVDYATALNNLAPLYFDQGKHKQAEPLYQRVLAIMEKTLGPDDPNTITFRANYTRLLEEMKRNKK